MKKPVVLTKANCQQQSRSTSKNILFQLKPSQKERSNLRILIFFSFDLSALLGIIVFNPIVLTKND